MKTHYLLFAALIITASSAYATVDPRCTGMLHQLDSMLHRQVPELGKLGKYIMKKSDNTLTQIVYIYHCPDSTAKDSIKRDYYEIYVGADGNRTKDGKGYYEFQKPDKRLFYFFIKKDLTEALIYDAKENTYLPIKKARQLKKWKMSIEQKKEWVDANLK